MKQCMLCGRESEGDICPSCSQEYRLTETPQAEMSDASNTWIDTGKFFAWILFVCAIIATLVYAFVSFESYNYFTILLVLGCIIAAILILCILQAFLVWPKISKV